MGTILSVITNFAGLIFINCDGPGGKDVQKNGTGIATGAVLVRNELISSLAPLIQAWPF